VGEPLDLLFLGSGNGFANGGRYWSSFLVNDRYLFDACPVALPHLKRMEVDLAAIEAVFISHFHADHLLGLPFFFLEYAHETRREKDLTVVGPPGIAQRVRTVMDQCLPDLLDRDAGYRLRFREVEDGAWAEVSNVRYVARRVDHAPDFPCFGYRAEIAGRTLAYSGDSRMCDALVSLGEGADVFVLECTFWDASKVGAHLYPDDIRELRRRLGPKPAFVLTHLDAGERDLGIENVLLADDLARFRL
jgi:ribonuclease BN (tRNA processing enzyme)